MTLWEVIIWAIILLVVAVILIYSFQKLFGQETRGLSTEIDALGDPDHDLIPNKLDCCDKEYGSGANKGCPQNKGAYNRYKESECYDPDLPPDA